MRQRRSSKEVRELVKEYRASGLTHRAFAEAKGVPVSTVSGWLRKTGARKTAQVKSSPLVPVVTKPQAIGESVVRIDLPCGRRVEVPGHISRGELAEILAAVDPRSC